MTGPGRGGILARRYSLDSIEIYDKAFLRGVAGRGNTMTMPNFFIVGAQKAGTTSLYHYLNQHPQVYMSPIKEPFFFDHELSAGGQVVRREFGGRRQPPRFANIEEYSALFDGVGDEKAIGEATPLYIYAPGTPERIERYVPGAKSIALLRHPADRAYSAFLYAVRIGAEPLTDFAQALRAEPLRDA